VSKKQKTSRMTIERINTTERQVVLGTTFPATLDGKNYFPKHISLYTNVRDSAVLARLANLNVGDEILANVALDQRKMQNYLVDFSKVI
jgi:hypothetical protein